MEQTISETQPQNLVSSITDEILRVTEIQKIYLETPGGQFAAALMREDLKAAREAKESVDIPKMILALQKLREYEL